MSAKQGLNAGAVVMALVGAVLVAAASEAPRVTVSADDLIRHGHQIEVQPGTEVFWNDPHFERVWFAPGSDVQVERTNEGFRAVFEHPGVYRGLYTIVGGHTSGDVYRMTVTVR